jgi:ribonuclease HII
VAALRLAFRRGYAALKVPARHVLLDGKHNWIGGADLLEQEAPEVQVTTVVKADRSCASVAAASVLAKVDRDARMRDLALQYPRYGWESNVGYGAPVHLAALRSLGTTEHHRHSWRLPAQSGL